MGRYEFVNTLRTALSEELPASLVEENVRYYESYISQEVAGGKTEAEVLEELGDPRLIARTILDTQGQQEDYSEGYGSFYEEQEAEREKGLHAEVNEKGGVDIKYRSFNFNTWYGKLLIAVVLILILFLIISIVSGILSLVLPILVPVLLVLFIIKCFTKY